MLYIWMALLAEEIAGKISDILDEPGDISDIIKNIKKLKGN